MRTMTLLLVCIALSLPVLACGGSSGSLHVEWQRTQRDSITHDSDPLPTLVSLTNDTDSTIRDAALYFSPGYVAGTPAGLSVGTITDVRTDYVSDASVWRLGDIKPGQRVLFRLSLWLPANPATANADSVDLMVLLTSPDLKQPVPSNQLSVRLTD